MLSNETVISGTYGSSDIESVINSMLKEYIDNDWFIHTYWPENETRVRMMMADVVSHCPPGRDINLLDVGCFNGYASFLCAQLGYNVTATDACDLDGRQEHFDKAGIRFSFSNFNELDAFAHLADKSFNVVIMGEVIEHVLNHPLGLMQSVARILRPGGLLVLTTPNPATVMNATRVLMGRWSLWGTRDFMELPKINEGRIISHESIHYREYLTSEIIQLLTEAGFSIKHIRYLGMGVTEKQTLLKRMLKNNLLMKRLMTKRLFGCTHYFLAQRS